MPAAFFRPVRPINSAQMCNESEGTKVTDKGGNIDVSQNGWQSVAAHYFDSACKPMAPVPVDAIEEVPVALSIAGVAYAVMMATPCELLDFAAGFMVTEGVISTVAEIRTIDVRSSAEGYEVEIVLAPEPLRRFLSQRRRRNLRGHTSCGLCGVEDLEDIGQQAFVRNAFSSGDRASPAINIAAVRNASKSLRGHQLLSRRTCAAHAAAWCTPKGQIVLAREDVGRHCALDKLIGACLRAAIDLSEGFCVITSRCSFELVQKAVMAQMPVLIAFGSPTAMAVRTAAAAGLVLIARSMGGDEAVYVQPGGASVGCGEELAPGVK